MRPIVVLTTGRAGSSLLCNILSQHGVWFGECQPADNNNKNGYFENIRLKKFLSDKFKYCLDDPNFVSYDEKWTELVEKVKHDEGYHDGPWAVKHSTYFYNLWEDYDPIFLFPRRNIESVLVSIRNANFWRYVSDERLMLELHHQFDFMDSVNAIDIDSEAIIAGDYTTLHRAFEEIGLKLREHIVNDIVDPKQWHN